MQFAIPQLLALGLAPKGLRAGHLLRVQSTEALLLHGLFALEGNGRFRVFFNIICEKFCGILLPYCTVPCGIDRSRRAVHSPTPSGRCRHTCRLGRKNNPQRIVASHRDRSLDANKGRTVHYGIPDCTHAIRTRAFPHTLRRSATPARSNCDRPSASRRDRIWRPSYRTVCTLPADDNSPCICECHTIRSSHRAGHTASASPNNEAFSAATCHNRRIS